MKLNKWISLPVIAFGLLSLTGCANYGASSLATLSPEILETPQGMNQVAVGCRAFSDEDCRTYLDRDVIASGYQPLQLYIQNNSEKNYSFALDRVDLPITRVEEVAEQVHTSTTGRAVGYGVGAIFIWPLAIPAIVDGVGSSNANKNLDSDFNYKAAHDQIIRPFSHMNSLIFVANEDFRDSFDITLIEEETGKAKVVTVHVKS